MAKDQSELPKIAHSAEDRARHRAIREKFRDEPTLRELVSSVEIDVATYERASRLQQSGPPVEVCNSIDLPKLADDLVILRKAMQQDATDTKQFEATVNVSKAAEAANEGNGPKALEYLKAAGKWAADTATKIGAKVASDALMKAIGVDKP